MPGDYGQDSAQGAKLAAAAAGLEIVEMDRHRKRAVCCGGGNAGYRCHAVLSIGAGDGVVIHAFDPNGDGGGG